MENTCGLSFMRLVPSRGWMGLVAGKTDVEQKIQLLLQRKKEKVAEVSELLETVESLQMAIASRAEGYDACTS
ncbi:hypothetical protein ATANTOWER_014835 [Ataeniobius toweri]|uniref:Uncharacterized protein n=1 Tax=Ataeniobius toweri TaxID=208326 RepID=A0ABU7B829_9TELE|nr:hypothetical protein [Ataeniobius toweri]